MNKSAPLGWAPLPGSNAPRGPFFFFLRSQTSLARPGTGVFQFPFAAPWLQLGRVFALHKKTKGIEKFWASGPS